MLQLPPLDGLSGAASGVSVYPDDSAPDIFYVVPAVPRIRRRGPDDEPALLFVKYRSQPTAPADDDAHGGLLYLQTELVLPEPTRIALVGELSARAGRPVTLKDPLYVDGSVELVTLDAATASGGGGDWVAGVAGSARPSFEPGLVSSFGLRLTRDGAALLWDQLRTAPCPVAIRYAMTMLARLPPATVRVSRASTSSGPADGAVQSDTVTVEVLDWPDDPSLAALRDELVEWASTLLEGRPQSELLLTARTAVPWPVRPQATIDGLVGETRGFVEADLSDPWFDLIGVDVRLDAAFERDRIAAVTVRLRYGEHRHDTVFTAAGGRDQAGRFDAVADPALGRTYRYQVEVQYAGTSQQLVLPEVETDTPQLLVQLGDVGWLRREVSAQNVDWDAVASVQVAIRYADQGSGVPQQDDVLALDRSTPTRSYERFVGAVVDPPVLQRTTYVLASGRRIEAAWAEHRGRLLLVPDVYERVLGVRFTAPGGFGTAAAHGVAVEHTGSGRTTRRTFTLTEAAPAAVWSLGLLVGEPEDYRYQVTSTNRDGTSSTGPWLSGRGSATVPVGPLPGALLRIEVNGELLDFAAVKLTTVRLTADGVDPGNVVFLPGRPTTQIWSTYLGQGVAPLYTWSADYHLVDGTRRAVSGGPTGDPALVVPPPPS